MSLIGIYKITNIYNNKIYIGSSSNLRRSMSDKRNNEYNNYKWFWFKEFICLQ